MYICVISEASRVLLCSRSMTGVLAGCVSVENGWQVAFDDDVYDRLMTFDEDIDKAIAIVCTGRWGRA